MGCCQPKRRCCLACIKGTFIYTFGLAIILFILIFGISPVIFKYSVGIQRLIIFPTYMTKSANFSDINSFGIKGVKNFYVNVNTEDNITLGLWHILPNEILSDSIPNDQYKYDEILKSEKYNILIYLHGNGQIRSNTLELYQILRQYFQIIGVDYRGYGDSTKAEMTDDLIVDDIVRLYRWLRNRTEARIFFWGHSLGTGVSTHTIANLKRSNNSSTPSGLILETPFSSVTDVVDKNPIAMLFNWLPWYRNVLLDPWVENGFGFESIEYIVDVDCPIMILHAKDDSVIPYEFAQKLYNVAVDHRDYETQGNVTFHLFEALGYDHMQLYLAPEIPSYVDSFIDDCLEFESSQRSNVTALASQL